MPVVRIHGSAGPLAALAAQVGNQQGRMRQFDEASETFRNGLAGREMNLREQGQAFDQGQTSLLNSIMMARQRAMAAQTGMDPNLAPQDMMALQQFQQRQADLTAKKTAAKTALQHAYANGIFGDPQSFDALGALQQLGPLADVEPDTVLSEIGKRTFGHVAQMHEAKQRVAAAQNLMAIADSFNDDRRAFVETLAMGVGGGWVKPADAYRAIGDLLDQEREQAGKLDLMQRQQAERFDLERMQQEGMDRRNKYAVDQRREAANTPSKRIADDRDYKALQLEIDDAEDDFDAVRDDLRITAEQIEKDPKLLPRWKAAQQAQKRLKAARQAARDYLKTPAGAPAKSTTAAPLLLNPTDADALLDQLEKHLGRPPTDEEVAEVERALSEGQRR